MTLAYDDKQEAIEQWTHDPCGAIGAASAEPGSRAFYEGVDRDRYDVYAPWMRQTMEFDRFQDESLLEIGFGMGTDLYQFASSGARVSGVDLSPEHLRLARQRFALYGLPADLRIADAEALPFADASFDAVYSFGVIHHTPDTEQAVREIRRVLKPGGRAILTVYHRYSAFFLFTVLLDWYVLRLGFLRGSYRRNVSRIEHREHSDACPLVKVYSRGAYARLLREFSEVRIDCRHLQPSHFGFLARFVPARLAQALERRGRLGWYLIAKCRK